MQSNFKRCSLAVMVTSALAVSGIAYGQDAKQQPQRDASQDKQAQAQKDRRDLSKRDTAELYRNTWSAREMLNTDVRGASSGEIGEVKDIIVGNDGKIQRVVVEVGGFFEIGDQHIGVPWKDVQIGPDMSHIQVPLREVENGTYSLYGSVPQGEEVFGGLNTWRVNELVGDYASLIDVPRYGMVSDALFDKQGKLQAVVVDRTAGPWGTPGWYSYPYYGYYPGNAHGLPYRSTEVANYGRFNYSEFARESDWAGDRSQRLQEQAQMRQDQGRVAEVKSSEPKKAQSQK